MLGQRAGSMVLEASAAGVGNWLVRDARTAKGTQTGDVADKRLAAPFAGGLSRFGTGRNSKGNHSKRCLS